MTKDEAVLPLVRHKRPGEIPGLQAGADAGNGSVDAVVSIGLLVVAIDCLTLRLRRPESVLAGHVTDRQAAHDYTPLRELNP